MADTSNSTPAPIANPPEQFDPAAWLDRFRDVGGWWVIGSDRKPSIGWLLNSTADPYNGAARALWREIEHDQAKRAAIRDHLLASAEEVL